MALNSDKNVVDPTSDHRYLTALQERHVANQAAGAPAIRYLMFWGHTNKKGESHATAACFSQWYPSPFVVNGATYHTAEQWMMAQKALLFASDEHGDPEEQRRNNMAVYAEIMATKDPSAVKKFGRMVEEFNEARWAANRFEIVKRGNYHKFTQSPDMLAFLLNTAKKYDVLVEASPLDNIWGIGLPASDDAAFNPLLWKGTNLLGFALTELRDELLAAEKLA